ncbi:SAM-dependent methyltransferase [Cytobacillus firmus]|uniref:SAM-dependent methyltransferase n=1 Tax=Cytobacillus firmus TaxID=1399 RepID=UPI0018CF7C80|nr:SAM-dependent methyltransferase [Cytobacillus firmus]MBG9587697.1 transcriptional regulator [Cytobacillus firmus]
MFTIKPIGIVHNNRKNVEDDYWSRVISVIELDGELENSCLEGLDTFSHIEVMYVFHLVPDNKIQYGSRHPRNNQSWPKVGIFAQRGKNRPNRIGSTIVKILKLQNTKIYVTGLDAIDKTPVIDIKPVMKEFLPKEEVKQPDWSSELMENYWN